MNANYNYRADSDIPLELTGSTPRKVFFIGGGVTGARVATIILALTTIFGVWTCIDALNQIRNRTILQRYGQEVVGEITGIGHASRYPCELLVIHS